MRKIKYSIIVICIIGITTFNLTIISKSDYSGFSVLSLVTQAFAGDEATITCNTGGEGICYRISAWYGTCFKGEYQYDDVDCTASGDPKDSCYDPCG